MEKNDDLNEKSRAEPGQGFDESLLRRGARSRRQSFQGQHLGNQSYSVGEESSEGGVLEQGGSFGSASGPSADGGHRGND